jgi:hypothetical protein
MRELANPDSAEWIGSVPELEEEELALKVVLPAGFLSARYRAGNPRQLVLSFNAAALPDDWSVSAKGRQDQSVLDAAQWKASGGAGEVTVLWEHIEPPAKLVVSWPDGEALWPLNVEDARKLPPPAALEKMSADEMLWILAASDPSAAFRAWARQHHAPESFDDDLDSVAPIDLDPLRRYDLHATFLHRVRRRARILAKLRFKLQQPVWGKQALEWRLRGFIGVEPLGMRLLRDVVESNGKVDEALLVLADFLIVLREVKYEPEDGSLKQSEFELLYFPFLSELANRLNEAIRRHHERISVELVEFWDRVVQRCQE